METTPSSTRRITRSQTRAASMKNTNLILSRKIEEPEKSSEKKQQQDRTVLVDITNGSPIVGVAMGNLETPSSSAVSKKKVLNSRAMYFSTPGSGESLLRGQVKTLLQKVEEDSELPKVVTRPFFNIQGFFNSPINLLAPTPANNGVSVIPPNVTAEKFPIAEIIICDPKNQETADKSENGITRSLLLDFSDKSDCSSSTGSSSREKSQSSDDDDNSSIWSIQANASSNTKKKYAVKREDDYEEEDYYYVDELCEGLSKVAVDGGDIYRQAY